MYTGIHREKYIDLLVDICVGEYIYIYIFLPYTDACTHAHTCFVIIDNISPVIQSSFEYSTYYAKQKWD